jgi:3-hydroxyisobutyrate dehydrogenase-like beta-hydroxyacid dehydrogenase
MSSRQLSVGFIGLGEMGRRMAINIARAGFPLHVYDIRTEMIEKLVKNGAVAGKNPEDIGRNSDCILLSLPGTEAVESVIFGENGIVNGFSSGGIIVDLSTMSYLATLRIKKTLYSKGITFIDAPVSGAEARAEDGTLTIMVGGDANKLEEVRSILDAIGKNIVYMGQSGNGQLTKLINQLLFNTSIAAMAEIMPVAVKLGLDPEAVGKAVTTGSGRSYALEHFIPLILDNNFELGYTLNKAYKDMISASEIRSELKIPMPVVSAAMHTYQLALIQGFGDGNKGSMIKVWEKFLGVEVRKKQKTNESSVAF